MRFRRSLRLPPGLRMDFSGSGFSLNAGPRAAPVSFGKRGAYLNTGNPMPPRKGGYANEGPRLETLWLRCLRCAQLHIQLARPHAALHKSAFGTRRLRDSHRAVVSGGEQGRGARGHFD
jgi:hypothetical protein